MLRLYNTCLLPVRLGVGIWAATRRGELARSEWAERRLKVLPRVPKGGLWVHGSSVGEVRIVGSLAREVRSARPALPLAASAYTPAGRAALPRPPDVDGAFFVPLDFPGLPERMLEALRPSALALVETELWPNLIHAAHRAEVPIVVLNGRLSPRRMARYRRLSSLYRPLLERLSRIGVQSREDAERFVELGAAREAVQVTGNVKYDLPVAQVDVEASRRRLDLAADRAVLVAGSTGAGEDALVLDAFEAARADNPELLLFLAPRHLARVDDVEALIRTRGLRAGRHSSAPSVRKLDVVLVDTMGELSGLYHLAWLAFVGGSLVPVGGHNLLEPAAAGKPVLYGPHVEHFQEPAQALEQAGGGLQVADAVALGDAVRELLADEPRRDLMGRRGLAVVENNRGAMRRSLSIVLDALDGMVRGPGEGAD